MFGYRTSLQRSTGFSPFELMFGREPNLPVDLLFGLDPVQEYHSDYVNKTVKNLKSWYDKAREAQEKLRSEYSLRTSGPLAVYKVGDAVLYWFQPVVAKDVPTKLSWRWRGPYRVVEVKDIHCIIDFEGVHTKVNFNRLCLYQPFSDDIIYIPSTGLIYFPFYLIITLTT